jgi:hypothetical protein
MNFLEILKANKGTVSSALGKELAEKVLNGDKTILENAIKYVTYDLENINSKGIRAGAAKILEKVAEKQPELIANKLDELKPALTVKEPQTRWMLMQVFGYCAKINPKDSESIIDYANKYLSENAGVCLSGAVHLYLGRIGATSDKTASKILPILDDALKTASVNEIDWILEAFLIIVDRIDLDSKELIKKNAEMQLDSKKKSTHNRAKKLLKKLTIN